MGSGLSRGKKVAPECVSEVNASTGVTSPKHSAPLRPLKIHTLLRSARNRAQQGGHSEDSERSAEEEDAEQDVAKKKSIKKTTTVRSRTYGLCHLNSEDTDEDLGSYHQGRASTEPCGGQEVYTRGYTRAVLFPRGNRSSSQTTRTRGSPLEAAAASKDQHSTCNGYPSLAMPVILYNASEEELMESIEREFG